jgi:hypothetical protein
LHSNIALDVDYLEILASVVRISKGLHIGKDKTLRAIKSGSVVGWMRFDRGGEEDIQALHYVVISEGETGWEDYVSPSWSERLSPNKFYFVLLVVPARPGPRENQEAYERHGVGVVLAAYVSSRDTSSKAVVV